jgi:hypothetical protein
MRPSGPPSEMEPPASRQGPSEGPVDLPSRTAVRRPHSTMTNCVTIRCRR